MGRSVLIWDVCLWATSFYWQYLLDAVFHVQYRDLWLLMTQCKLLFTTNYYFKKLHTVFLADKVHFIDYFLTNIQIILPIWFGEYCVFSQLGLWRMRQQSKSFRMIWQDIVKYNAPIMNKKTSVKYFWHLQSFGYNFRCWSSAEN